MSTHPSTSMDHLNIQKPTGQDYLRGEFSDSALAIWLTLILTTQCLYFIERPTLDHSSQYNFKDKPRMQTSIQEENGKIAKLSNQV